jgi:pilus assembly protein Flp/PilA
MTSIDFLRAWISTKVRDERAASLVEYALLVALIAVVCIAAVTTLGRSASENFSSISDSL